METECISEAQDLTVADPVSDLPTPSVHGQRTLTMVHDKHAISARRLFPAHVLRDQSTRELTPLEAALSQG